MTNPTETKIQLLPLDQVDADPDQPRKRFERQALDELATSLASVGLLEPIIVRPVADRFVIIAGERRWRAAAIAGWTSIPAIVRDVHGAEAFELSMIENVVRADMNPIEEGTGYQRLVDAGMAVETIAARLGKTAQDIRFRIALLKLDGPIADLVAAGQLGAWDAWHIARLSIEGQHQVIRAMRNGELTKTGAVRQFALAVFEQESQISAFGDDEAPAVKTADARMARDVRMMLTEALTRIQKVAELVESGQAAPDEYLALVAPMLTKEARRLAERVERQAARQLASQTSAALA